MTRTVDAAAHLRLFFAFAIAILLSACSKEPASAAPAQKVARDLAPVIIDPSPRQPIEEKTLVPSEQLTLGDGRIFKNWRITGQSSDSVYIKHNAGMAKVQKRLLPDSLRSEYPMDFELARQERENDARRVAVRNSQAAPFQNVPVSPPRTQVRDISVDEVKAQSVSRSQLMVEIREKAQERANNFFRYEFEPSSTSRILSFNVSIDADEPEQWAGIPGRYTVDGKGYLQFYQRYRGADRETREFRVHLDANGGSVSIARFELR